MAQLLTPPSATTRTTTTEARNGPLTHVFQPPSHGSPSAPEHPHMIQSDYFTSASRKRPRTTLQHRESNDQMPLVSRARQSACEEDVFAQLSTESLHVNERYRLKGGFDTPALLAGADSDRIDDMDANARRSLHDGTMSGRNTEPAFAGPLARERNGFARPAVNPALRGSNHKSSPSWTRIALTLPFSIAGKMFSFGSTVLHGFYAGGGHGYEIDHHTGQRSGSAQENPVPGRWRDSSPAQSHHDTDFEGDFEQDNPRSIQRPPPSKRRLTDKDTWIMVGTPDLEDQPAVSPERPPPSSITTPRLIRPGNPRTTSRKSLLPASRRQSHISTAGSPSLARAFSPQQSPARRVPSPSRPRRTGGGGHFSSNPQSPARNTTSAAAAHMSPEAGKLLRRQAKQERTMSSMSRQLEELIRQGQAALGTKFTVQDNGTSEDEGFVDED